MSIEQRMAALVSRWVEIRKPGDSPCDELTMGPFILRAFSWGFEIVIPFKGLCFAMNTPTEKDNHEQTCVRITDMEGTMETQKRAAVEAADKLLEGLAECLK